MLWSFRKTELLESVQQSLHIPRVNRTVKHNVVIDLIQTCIRSNRDAIMEICGSLIINPLHDTHVIIHILKNFYIMDLFPAHKKIIKKILS
jgi:hypothetical protein